MTAPRWLDQVLADSAVLDLNHPDGRSEMASRITEALPRDRMVEILLESLSTRVRAAAGAWVPDIATVAFARNVVQALSLCLEVVE